METKHLWVFALVLTALVLVAGCIEEPTETSVVQEGEMTAAEALEIERAAENAAAAGMEEEEITELVEELADISCISDEECDDDNFCTTDSCTKGECANVLTPGCADEETGYIAIVGINYGDAADEWIELDAKNMDVRGWTLETNGTVKFKFGDVYYDLNNKLKIHTGYGISVSTNAYMSKNEPMWIEGEPIYLKNTAGSIVVTYP